MEIKQRVAGKTGVMDTEVSLKWDSDVKEINRLRFVLDKANRFPELLSSTETLKLSRKLADLERRTHKYSK
ncbi:MAG: hypothetical protein ABIF85_02740 [Nanoarchaeota archaeon]|nr:hypothetical protein [Nanoarchaeota archaeon]MBU4452196.1 hypothetical protein [Nanoarchaeota archaeon]MCG2724366.1 hypothetical protein [archaeon]